MIVGKFTYENSMTDTSGSIESAGMDSNIVCSIMMIVCNDQCMGNMNDKTYK